MKHIFNSTVIDGSIRIACERCGAERSCSAMETDCHGRKQPSNDRRKSLQVGDVVSLRSGGPLLTIVKLDGVDRVFYSCTGFVEGVGFVDVRASAECWKLEGRIEDQP